MKKYSLIVLSVVLLVGCSYGQNKKILDGAVLSSKEFTITSTGTVTLSGNIKIDTIKAIMLICNTSELPTKVYNWGEKQSYSVWNTHSLFGYEVVTVIQSSYDMMPIQYETNHIAWLDENKKQLSKNIIVWQSQKQNQ